MASKSDKVHDQIRELMKLIEKLKADKDLAINLKQKAIKQRKIDQ